MNSVIVDLPLPVSVVCHDAGAANHIVAWLQADGTVEHVQPYMEGPAQKIWREAFPDKRMACSVTEALSGARSSLSGTGWASNLEHEARCYARHLGLKSVAMIDHWVNYENRFIRDGDRLVPDEIWVVDEYAHAIARQTFPGCQVRLKEDAYSRRLLTGVQPVSEVRSHELLYILEPMRSEWGRGDQGEFQALDYMLTHLPFLKLPEDTVFKLRPHPSDRLGKYNDYLARQCGHRIEMDRGRLMESLSSAKWVAGCESFALTLALEAGRTVFCTLPPWAPACRLPHAGLIHLKNLTDL